MNNRTIEQLKKVILFSISLNAIMNLTVKVLFCTAECDPFVKIGGLGDVSRALPQALSKLGIDVRVILPLYEIVDRGKFNLEKMREFTIHYSGEDEKVTVWQTVLPGSNVVTLLFENKEYLSGGGTDAFTGLDAEMRRFGFFDRAVVKWLEAEKHWHPDVLHLNDWHLGLVPQILNDAGSRNKAAGETFKVSADPTLKVGEASGLLNKPATLLTIHNISFQGIADLGLFAETGLSIEKSKVLSWDAQDENVTFLLQGIAGADVINTVSPTYAKEIMTPEFGEGLNEVLRSREGRIYGVLNGVDTNSFDPEQDEDIFRKYSVNDWQAGKAVNKKKLQEEAGLEVKDDTFLIGFVGRLDPDQKGLELIQGAWQRVKSKNVQMVLLGVGDPEWENIFAKMGEKHENFSAQIKFDKVLARKIFAGCDAIVMPSKYEPCGLPQMMAMRYGTVPVVHKVGGLADTVEDGKNGFTFEKYKPKAFAEAIERARAVYVLSRKAGEERSSLSNKVATFTSRQEDAAQGAAATDEQAMNFRNVAARSWRANRQDKERGLKSAISKKDRVSSLPGHANWQCLVQAGMIADFSWDHSAKRYIDLYHEALGYRFGVKTTPAGEYREDQFTGEWRIVAGGRKERPQEVSEKVLARLNPTQRECPFAEGREDETPPEVLRIGRGAPNGPGWCVRVIPNKFPILPGHEVIIHSPVHNKDIAELPLAQVENIVQAYLFRFRHYDSKGLPFIFNNHGPKSGTSLEHPHSQLIVFDRTPEALQEKLDKAEEYFRREQACPYCELLKREETGKRKVLENSHFVALVPYAAKWPYQLWIVPKKHRANFSNIDRAEVTALADVLTKASSAVKEKFGKKASYNFWIHSLSEKFLKEDEEQKLYFHWHLELVPREKQLGGVELGSEIMVYSHGTPESAAEELCALMK